MKAAGGKHDGVEPTIYGSILLFEQYGLNAMSTIHTATVLLQAYSYDDRLIEIISLAYPQGERRRGH